jgi:hypothetical protein
MASACRVCSWERYKAGDLKDYVTRRKEADKEFASGYDAGYEGFKLGVILQELRIQKGMTQEELAEKMHIKKAVIPASGFNTQDPLAHFAGEPLGRLLIRRRCWITPAVNPQGIYSVIKAARIDDFQTLVYVSI